MATVRKEKYQRGPIGQMLKWLFVAFNLIMLVWLISGLIKISGIDIHSQAERAGATIGATLAISALLMIWALGDIILGVGILLTRGDKVVIEEITGGSSEATADSPMKSDELIQRYLRKAAKAGAKQNETVLVTHFRDKQSTFGRRQGP